MGRNISKSNSFESEASLSGSIKTRIDPAGFMGVFGTGRWKVFWVSETFTIPIGMNTVRIRVVGGGGGAPVEGSGGAGGGYAHGVFNVTPGDTHTVTVGSAGRGPSPLTPGGTSSFGSLISATGGSPGTTLYTSPIPGVGIGGDFQAKGGTSIRFAGGGAAGSQLGDGGSGMMALSGGGGVGGSDSYGGGGSSLFESSYTLRGGKDFFGFRSNGPSFDGQYWSPGGPNNIIPTHGYNKNIESIVRFPFDGFVGGGGGVRDDLDSTLKWGKGGSGAGGGASFYDSNNRPAFGGDGGVGGGGGATRAGSGAINGLSVTLTRGGTGGIGGGGGGSRDTESTKYGGANGGQGLVIVEW